MGLYDERPGASSQPPSLAAQAVKLAAQGRLDQAESTYRELAKQDPEDGHVRLARFLAATGQTTAARELSADPAVTAMPPRARARPGGKGGDGVVRGRPCRPFFLSDSSDATREGDGTWTGGGRRTWDAHANGI